jgi:hypothetical protein
VVAAALVPMTAAVAADSTSDPVEALKASLQTTVGFEVDDVRTSESGASCIRYRVTNDTGGESKAQAVVDGNEVLRSTSRSTKFAKAWNSKCAGAKSSGKSTS